jgi:predicted XRE-type DNA-binding protein
MRTRARSRTDPATARAVIATPPDNSLKVQLAMEVNNVLRLFNLTQAEAAERLGLLQPHVSELAHLRLDRFSAERLMELLARLGQEVEIRIHAGASGLPRASTRRIFIRRLLARDGRRAP